MNEAGGVMKKTEVSLSDNLFYAAAKQARKEERHSGNSNGVPSLIRHALHYYLNKNGWEAAFLRGDISIAEIEAKIDSEAVPGTRKGNCQEGQG
jgi:uncharacterized damage-inducible protein DinB